MHQHALIATILILLTATQSMAQIPLATEPGGLEAVTLGPTEIELFWTPGAPGTEITITRDGRSIGQADASLGRWRDSGLLPNTLYTYCVSGAVVAEKTDSELLSEGQYDIVVFDASASGVAAAVAAARLGSRVALIEDTLRLGGMAANGLGSTDIRNPASSNGFFDEFRERVRDYYGTGNGLRYEPRVANAVIKSLVYEQPKISLFRRTRFRSAMVEDGRIVGIRVLHEPSRREASIYGRIVVDATVEGDVAASAGAKARVGREPRTEREPHAGVIYFDNRTYEILPGSTGKGDKRLQSYAYLMTVKDYGAGTNVTIPEPPGYDPEEFRPSPRWEESWAYTSGRLPNNEFEINQHPFGIDLPEVNYNYPFEDAAGRAAIAELYKNRALQYLYYVQTELGRPNIGLSDDEYRAEGGWPAELYVREARRVEGLTQLDETDISAAPQNRRTNSIAIGDYPMDSHAIRTVSDPTARHRGEGEWWLAKTTPWYQVPPGILVPRGVRGLLVSTAVSATHVAYGTLRMEPVRMSLGQAAGVLAHMALFYDREPEATPLPIVQDKLLNQRAYLYRFTDVNKHTRHFKAIQWLAVARFFEGDEFEPEAPLLRSQAEELLGKLAGLAGAPRPVLEQSEVPGGAPITRAEFAKMLVETMRQSREAWQYSTSTGHYADLSPGSTEELYAETLYKRHIRASAWLQPSGNQVQYNRFYPNAPITRADAAEAVYLAVRPTLVDP